MIIYIFNLKFVIDDYNCLRYLNNDIFEIIQKYDDEFRAKLNILKDNLYTNRINKKFVCLHNLYKLRNKQINNIKNICPHNQLYQEKEDDYHKITYEYYCILCDKYINKQQNYNHILVKNKHNYYESTFVKKRKIL